MDPLNIVLWGVAGAVIGLIVSLLLKTPVSSVMLLDVVVGLVGGLIGGVILRLLNVAAESDLAGNVHLPSFVIALLGAIILVGAVEILRRQRD